MGMPWLFKPDWNFIIIVQVVEARELSRSRSGAWSGWASAASVVPLQEAENSLVGVEAMADTL